MSKTVDTGVGRQIAPGKCDNCGSDDDWESDGRGALYCSCECCSECLTYDGHDRKCSFRYTN
jgi:hypothetical protein